MTPISYPNKKPASNVILRRNASVRLVPHCTEISVLTISDYRNSCCVIALTSYDSAVVKQRLLHTYFEHDVPKATNVARRIALRFVGTPIANQGWVA